MIVSTFHLISNILDVMQYFDTVLMHILHICKSHRFKIVMNNEKYMLILNEFL